MIDHDGRNNDKDGTETPLSDDDFAKKVQQIRAAQAKGEDKDESEGARTETEGSEEAEVDKEIKKEK